MVDVFALFTVFPPFEDLMTSLHCIVSLQLFLCQKIMEKYLLNICSIYFSKVKSKGCFLCTIECFFFFLCLFVLCSDQPMISKILINYYITIVLTVGADIWMTVNEWLIFMNHLTYTIIVLKNSFVIVLMSCK